MERLLTSYPFLFAGVYTIEFRPLVHIVFDLNECYGSARVCNCCVAGVLLRLGGGGCVGFEVEMYGMVDGGRSTDFMRYC